MSDARSPHDDRSTQPLRPVPTGGRRADDVSFEVEGELIEILDGYVAQLKAGQAPSRQELIARYPHLAEQLEACLAGLEFIHQAAPSVGDAPRRLGDFHLLREIGRGGMGAVYEAEQVSLGRRVAVKVLRFGGVSDPEAVDRFHREAETVAQLHHTNIVPIFFVGSQDGVNYYAMQFIEGRSLADVLADRGKPIAPQRVADWGLQAAEALAHAHQRGVIHRDVKPSNLLIDAAGRIWLTDFGLAKRLNDVTLSITGALLGTPRYMSPEQASAARHRVDHRTDIYSLGATLYELVTGQPVFAADKPYQVIGQILHEEPTPPRRLVPTIPRDLETILLKCLAKEPDRRYASAQALADDLRAVLDGRTIRARPTGPIERTWRWMKRHRQSVKLAGITAGVTAGAVALVLLLSMWYGRRQMSHLTLATNQPPLTAELRTPTGKLIARETMPTPQPVDVPAGNYQLRIAGSGRLSETFHVNLRRGESPKFDLNLDASLVMRPLEFASSYRIVAAGKGALGVLLQDGELQCWDLRRDRLRWTASLQAADHAALSGLDGWLGAWNPLLLSSLHRNWGPFDLDPFIANPAVDLNGDDVPDLLLAARHQAWLVALSGQDGQLLWVAPRGRDVHEAISDASSRSLRGVVSAVVDQPTSTGDVNGDGVCDFAVSWIEGTPGSNSPKRWLEAVSGADGKPLWQREMDERWFQTAAHQPIPQAYRWYPGSAAASSWRGGDEHLVRDDVVRRRRAQLERTGYFHQVSSRPALLRGVPHKSGTPSLGLVAGSGVLLVDAATGESLGEPIDCGLWPSAPPIVADVDGDGVDELVVMQRLGSQIALGGPGTNPRVRIGVLSIIQRRLLWSRDIQAQWPTIEQPLLAAPQWPKVVDLQQDGHAELVVPNGTSVGDIRYDAAWGTIEVVDAVTGATRWQRTLKTMDQQIDHFVAGPDIDGDGTSEIFAATLWSRQVALYVDALSGRDGHSLWVGRHVLRELNESARYHLAPPLWWGAGEDGWPQLIVPAHPGDRTETPARLCAFSAGTGKLERIGSSLIDPEVVDADGDGIEDLFASARPNRSAPDSAGTLVGFRGQRRELWTSVGDLWRATTDLDGDGTIDLIRTSPDGSCEAISGVDRRSLWTARLSERDGLVWTVVAAATGKHGALSPATWVQSSRAEAARALANSPTGVERRHSSQPRSPTDWDGDGTNDLLAYVSSTGRDEPFSPLIALSGRTGKRLWSAQLSARVVEAILALEVKDLDGDGKAEVVWAASSDWGFESSKTLDTHFKHLQLGVFSGQTGKLLWKQALTRTFGLSQSRQPSPYQFDQGWLAVQFGDVTGDGTLDVLVPAEAKPAADGPRQELRALSGTSGERIWGFQLPVAREMRYAMSDVPAAEVVDLDGDSQSEVILLAFDAQAARLSALEGQTGQLRWSASFDVPESCGRLLGDSRKFAQRPRPLILRTQDHRPRVALNLWDGPERVVVVDAAGQVVSDFRLATERGPHRGEFRLWSCDIQGDGDDELLLIHRDHLMAIRPDQPDRPLWQRPTDHLWSDQIEGILPAGAAHGQQIVVRRVEVPGLIYAVDAATGQTVWTAAIPTPRRDGYYVQPDTAPVALLNDTSCTRPAWIFYQHEFVTGVREVNMYRTGGHRGSALRSELAVAPLGTRKAACVSGWRDDPRQLRPLPAPWHVSPFAMVGRWQTYTWSAFYAISLLYLPGAYIGSLLRRREWSLRRYLMLPLVASAPIVASLVDAPQLPVATLSSKLLIALAALPPLWAAVRLAQWTLQGRWRLSASWLVATLFVSAAMAVAVLSSASAHATAALQPGERYRWDGWYSIWYYGAYTTAWLMAAACLLGSTGRWLLHALPARRKGRGALEC